MIEAPPEYNNARKKLRVLCLCSPAIFYINTIREHIESLQIFSSHDWTFVNAAPDRNTTDGLEAGGHAVNFAGYDVVVVHYSTRVCFHSQVSARVSAALAGFSGCKCLFIQDDYDFTDHTRQWIKNHGISVVFTVVPERYVSHVYPPHLLPGVTFVPVLTGYVPVTLENVADLPPLAERKKAIAYRGRALPFYYGDLGHEKLMIGIRVRERCEQRGMAVDIEWTDDKRIYRRDWNRFLHCARATLCTESGCNVFDIDGRIKASVDAALKADPGLRYEDVRGKLFTEENIGVRMNQISPKIFEFIAARTAIIAFDGEYSGVIEPDRHFIVLKKDYSNLDAVLDKLDDLPYLEALSQRAFDDVVASGRYSWRSFVRMVDDAMEAGTSAQARDEQLQPHPMPPPPRWLAGSLSLLQSPRVALVKELLNRNEAIITDHEGMIERRKAKVAKLKVRLDKLVEKISSR